MTTVDGEDDALIEVDCLGNSAIMRARECSTGAIATVRLSPGDIDELIDALARAKSRIYSNLRISAANKKEDNI